MKTLSEQIVVMQHVEQGGPYIIRNKDGSVNQIIIDVNAEEIAFDWAEFDYDIYEIPENFWFKILDAQGTATAFNNKADFDSDPSNAIRSGRYYKLGKLEIDLLTANNLIPTEV